MKIVLILKNPNAGSLKKSKIKLILSNKRNQKYK